MPIWRQSVSKQPRAFELGKKASLRVGTTKTSVLTLSKRVIHRSTSLARTHLNADSAQGALHVLAARGQAVHENVQHPARPYILHDSRHERPLPQNLVGKGGVLGEEGLLVEDGERERQQRGKELEGRRGGGGGGFYRGGGRRLLGRD